MRVSKSDIRSACCLNPISADLIELLISDVRAVVSVASWEERRVVEVESLWRSAMVVVREEREERRV